MMKRMPRYAGLIAFTMAVGFACGLTGQASSAQAVGGQAARARVSAQTGSPGAIRARVAIRHKRMSADGRESRVAVPPVHLRVESRRELGRWRTRMDFEAAAPVTVKIAGDLVPLQNPFLVSRMEFDDELGGEPRMYDRLGRQVRLPTEEDRKRFGITPAQRRASERLQIPEAGPAGIRGLLRAAGAAGLVADSRQRENRRTELTRRLGRPLGRVRGLDRFVSVDGQDTQEVLVDAAAALPVEINTVRNARLVGRAELHYDALPAVGHLRQFMRTEHAVEGGNGDRTVTEVELSDVTVTPGGAE